MIAAAGLMGWSEIEFYNSTPQYFFHAFKAWSNRQRELQQANWEQSRYVAFYSMQATGRYKIRRYTDIGLFPWEKEEVIVWAPIDPAELEAFNALADSAHAFHTSTQQ